MRTDAPQWITNLLQKSEHNPLKILAGEVAKLEQGSVFKSLVQRSSDSAGGFKISFNGEPFIVKGLPTTAIGKELTFMARSSGKGGTLELNWINGKGKQRGAIPVSAAQQKSGKSILATDPEQKGMKSQLLSPVPTALKGGKSITARIGNVEKGEMQLLIQPQTAEQKQSKNLHQLLTTPIQGAKKGMTVQLRLTHNDGEKPALQITPFTPKSKSHPVANISGTGAAVSAKEVRNELRAIPEGARITVPVVKQLPNAMVEIKVGKINIEVPAPAHVKRGDMLELSKLKEENAFRVIGHHQGVAKKAALLLRQAIPAAAGQNLSEHITTLRSTITATPPDQLNSIKGAPQLMEWLNSSQPLPHSSHPGERTTQLARLMRNAGELLEAKLAAHNSAQLKEPAVQSDLKGILVKLGEAKPEEGMPTERTRLIRRIAEAAQQGTQRIELNQALNLVAATQSEPMRLEIPLLIGQQLVNLQMSIQSDLEQHTTEDGSEALRDHYSVLFALELEGLGELRIDASLTRNSVHARLYNESAEVRAFLMQHITILQERLQNIGFEEVFLVAVAPSTESEHQTEFENLKAMRPNSLSLLDLLA